MQVWSRHPPKGRNKLPTRGEQSVDDSPTTFLLRDFSADQVSPTTPGLHLCCIRTTAGRCCCIWSSTDEASIGARLIPVLQVSVSHNVLHCKVKHVCRPARRTTPHHTTPHHTTPHHTRVMAFLMMGIRVQCLATHLMLSLSHCLASQTVATWESRHMTPTEHLYHRFNNCLLSMFEKLC